MINADEADNTVDEDALSGDAYWRKHSAEVYRTLKAEIPDQLAGASPIALGSHGFAVDHGDGTLSKIFIRHEKPEEQAYAEQIYKDELKIMQLMGGKTIGAAQTPEVISQTDLSHSGRAFASYRMTKLEGREIDWEGDLQDMPQADITRHFGNAGRLLARFHEETAELLKGVTPPERGFAWGTHVEQVPALDDKTNALLEKCDAYLKANMEPGVCHGDFHPKNFKVNDKLEITGLFDMSFAGEHPNRLMDFAMMPDNCAQHAITAYERAGGKKVDPVMLTLTKICQDAAVLNWHTNWPHPNSDQIIEKTLKKLNSRLDAVKDTVMQPEAPQPYGPRLATSPKNRPGL